MAIEDYLEQISRNIGQSPRNRVISDSFYGLNIVGRNMPIPVNMENHGYTFFSRPVMNMSYDNLATNRVLSNLLVANPYSVQRMIRVYLDPGLLERENLDCPGVDNRNPFIPLLTNNLISAGSWPDFTLQTTTSPPGLYREEYSYVDDIPYNYGSYDIQALFRNISGDPISFLFLMWGWYMGLVYEGRIMPLPENVLYNAIDYQTRIWRLVMDHSRTYITRIGVSDVAFPLTAPLGNIFNFSGDGAESPFLTANDQLSVNFRCMGFTYYDHILVYEFNTLVAMFNRSMADEHRTEELVKLQPHEKEYFNHRAYPWINEATMELEWWVFKNYYQDQIDNLIRTPVQSSALTV